MSAAGAIASLVRAAVGAARAMGYDAHARRLDLLTGREGVVVRAEQPRVRAAYFDGTRELLVPLRATCRYRSEARAQAACCDLADGLPMRDLSGDGYSLVGAYAYAEPSELRLEEQGFYAWSCVVAALVTTQEAING